MALNLGGLFFTLDADTRGLMNSQRRVEQFANTVRQAFRGVNSGTVAPQFANQLLRQERAVVGMLERVKQFQAQVGQTRIGGTAEAQALINNVSRAYDNFTRKMAAGVPLNNLDFSRRMQHMTSQLNDARRAFSDLNIEANKQRGLINFTGLLQGLGASSLVVQGHLGGMSTRFIALSSLVREFGVAAAIASASVAGLAAGIGLVTVGAVKAGRELQGLTAGFNALSGNAAVTGLHLEFVRDVAGQAGLKFNDVAIGYRRFLASAQAGGLTLDQTQTAFKGVSLAAATMQLSVEDTQGVFRALDQMLSKGTVQAEELRGQLGDRLPGAFQIAASAMGKTTSELNKMLKAGDVVASEFVPKFVDELMRLWNIDAALPINTLTAAINNLSNEWTYFGQNLDRATGATRFMQDAINNLVGLFRVVSTNIREIIGVIGGLVGALTGLAAAWAIGAVVAWVSAIGGIANIGIAAGVAIINLRNAVMGLNVVMAANPIGGVITVLVRLAAVIGGTVLGYKLFTSAVDANTAAFDSGIGPIEAYIESQRGLEYQTRSTTQALIDQVRTMNVAASLRATDAMSNAAALQRGSARQSLGLYARSVGTGLTDLIGGEKFKTPEQIRQDLIGGFTASADDAIKEAQRTARAYAELQQMAQRPDQPTMAPALNRDTDAAKKLREEAEKIPDWLRTLQSAFERATEEIDDSAFAYGEFQKQINLLMEGADPDTLGAMFEPFARAREMMKGLNDTTDEGRTALAALQSQMTTLGVGVQDTGNLFEDTRNQLAAFLQQEYQAGKLVNALGRINDEMRDLREETADLNILTQAYSSGMMGAWAGEEAQRVLARASALRELERTLKNAGATQEQINQLIKEYDQLLTDADEAEYVYDRARASAEDFRNSIQDAVTTGINGFRDLLKGVKSLGDALWDLTDSIINGLWQAFINNPINDFIASIGRSSGGGGGGGGLWGMIGSIGSGVASILGTGGVFGNIDPSTVGVPKDPFDIFNKAKGRAFGGPVNAGQLYQINEPGLMGEYFIPSTNGKISPNAPANDSGGIYIDARTTIDARGATVDAVQALRQEMATRDQRLRQELPYLVDARVRDSSGRGRYG